MGCASSQIKNIPEGLPTQRNEKIENKRELARAISIDPEDNVVEQLSQDIENKKQVIIVVHKNKFEKRRQIEQLQNSRLNDSPVKNIMPKTPINKQKTKKYHEMVYVTEATDIQASDKQDKFIKSIMQRSRSKMLLQNPQIPHKNSDFLKPVVDYKKTNKGKIIQNESQLKKSNIWNTPISSSYEKENNIFLNPSYVGINEPPKSPSKIQAINKKIRNITIQSYKSIQSL